MQIKTLAEILAESDSDSASTPTSRQKPSATTTAKAKHPSSKSNHSKSSPARSIFDNGDTTQTSDNITPNASDDHSAKLSKTTYKRRKKRFHPAANFKPEPNDDTLTYQPPEPQSIKEMLAEVKQQVHGSENKSKPSLKTQLYSEIEVDSETAVESDSNTITEATGNPIGSVLDRQTDNLPSALKAYLRTPEQRQAETDAIKAESRLRWLAFYYLSRREYGKAELRQKLIDKEQDPDKIDALLDEFESKGYQSDYRTTLMLIRESIRKGRGRGRIRQDFYHKKIAMPSNIDELIDMANAESDEFNEFVDSSADSLVEGVDWLKLAVTARIKKYGDDVPIEQKDKAKQLRFLQYRGFNTDICFQALIYTLDTLDERF